MALSEGGGKQHTFCADVFECRPEFEKIQSSSSQSVSVREQLEEAMKRKNCPVSWVGLYVDQFGLLAVFVFKHRLILGHAKTTAEAVLQPFLNSLPEQYRRAVELGLRPLDELDQQRIMAWKTTAAVRPAEDSDTETEDEAEEVEAPKSAAQLLAEHECSQIERAAKRRRTDALALPSIADRDVGTVVEAVFTHPATSECRHQAAWAYLAQEEATIHVASAGEQPASLSYIRCHREQRRVQLLVKNVNKDYVKAGLLTVVKVAVRLAKDGCLPGHEGPRARKTEFIRRCQDAMEVLAPGSPRQIPEATWRQIQAILGGEAPEWPEDGCLACGHKRPKWVSTQDGVGVVSRCDKCRMPYAYKRTWDGRLLPRDAAGRIRFERPAGPLSGVR